jgi:hypothetical protein
MTIVHDDDRHFGRVLVGRHLLQIGQRIGAFIDDLDPELFLDDGEDVGVEILRRAGRTADDDLLDFGAHERRHAYERTRRRRGARLQKPSTG